VYGRQSINYPVLFIGDWVGSESTCLESTGRKSSGRVGRTVAERDKEQTWASVTYRCQDRCRRWGNAEASDRASRIGDCVSTHVYPLRSITPPSVPSSQLPELSSVRRRHLVTLLWDDNFPLILGQPLCVFNWYKFTFWLITWRLWFSHVNFIGRELLIHVNSFCNVYFWLYLIFVLLQRTFTLV